MEEFLTTLATCSRLLTRTVCVFRCCYTAGLSVSALQLCVLHWLWLVCPRDNAFMSWLCIVTSDKQLTFDASRLSIWYLLTETNVQTWSEACLALFFLRESRFYGSGVLAKVWDAEMREFYASHNLSALMLLLALTHWRHRRHHLWAGLAKRSKEISC